MPSTSPMTPRSTRSGKKFNLFASLASNPSTTPAGPPPSSAGSFTPIGEPPSSLFGSGSRYGSGKLFSSRLDADAFRSSPTSKRETPIFKDVRPRPTFGTERTENGSPVPARSFKSTGTFTVPDDSLLESQASDADGEDEHEDDSMMGVDIENRDVPLLSFQSSFLDRAPASPSRGWKSNSLSGSKRQRESNGTRASKRLATTRSDMSAFRESPIPAIAKNIAAKGKLTRVDEPGGVIVATEDAVSRLQRNSDSSTAAPSTVANDLLKAWSNYTDQRENAHICPPDNASGFNKAAFLASILLPIHHPPTKTTSLALSRSLRQSALFSTQRETDIPQSIPQVLLSWLNSRNNAAQSAILDLQSYHPDPSNHPDFWELVFTSLLHGKIKQVVTILQQCNFKHLRASDEERRAYSGSQLASIKLVMDRAVQVLAQCPAMVNDDWEVTSGDWVIWRLRVSQAAEDLTMFVEGMDQIGDDTQMTAGSFTAENFGIRSLRNTSSRLESRVPFAVHQNLKTLYGILLGGETEIISFAADWIEATIGLTAWWNGDEQAAQGRRREQSFAASIMDSDGVQQAYVRRLAASFRRVTDETEEEAFQVNTLSPVEVGLASIFEGNLDGVIGILQTMSLTIAAAVVETACVGGWLDDSTKNLGNQLTQSDLMVLSYGQTPADKGVDRDETLIAYADALFRRGNLDDDKQQSGREGWEIGVQVVGRLHDTAKANSKLQDLLLHMPLSTRERVDKLFALCNRLDLSEHARKIASRYADQVAEKTYKYGEALVYYALAHDAVKTKAVLNFLISHSLVNSIAFPPENEMDDRLKELVTTPVKALKALAAVDSHAASLLQTSLSGYATLRLFYDLRDQTGLAGAQKLPVLARKKEAARALLAVIASSEDNIHGGLYDEDRGSVVAVNGLLALLGEALVFLEQPEPLLDVNQIFTLLKAVDDMATTHSKIRDICEEFLASTIQACPQAGSATTSSFASMSSSVGPATRSRTNGHPPKLGKDLSSMTASSGGFSLVGSMQSSTPSLSSSLAFTGSSSGNTLGVSGLNHASSGSNSLQSSGFLVMPTVTLPQGDNNAAQGVASAARPISRGWDWRIPASQLGGNFGGEQVLRILRVSLSNELARGWLGEV